MTRSRRPTRALIVILPVLSLLWGLFSLSAWGPTVEAAAPIETFAPFTPPLVTPLEAAPTGTDLAIEELVLWPPNPHTTVPATITVSARNTGDVSVAGRRIYLYIDPPTRPPTSDTPATKEFVVGVAWPPGDPMTVEYAEFTFTQPGCDHVVYAWVDPLDRIAETNEDNNLRKIDVCVEHEVPGTQSDTYEEDDACAQASTIAVNAGSQIRNFAPLGDVDWVQFQATQGVTYSISAAGTGAEAWPSLEMWDTCDTPPPGAFGTTSRLDFIAPQTGLYTLRIENESTSYDLFESSYELRVQSAESISGVRPTVTEMEPLWSYNDRNANAVITGTNFLFPPLVELCSYSANACQTNQCTQLLNASWITGQRLFAVVQANLTPGEYCLSVINPGGRGGLLPQAFSVLPGPPDLREVRPNQTYGDRPADINLYGFNFAPGIAVSLGNLALENVRIVNGTHLQATVPGGLTPGVYDISAGYNNGDGDTLSQAYTILAPTEDLFGQVQEFWVEPTAPRANSAAKVGLVVHRRDGEASLADILVRFWANGVLIGDGTVPLLAPNSQTSSEWALWTPAQAGSYELVAQIDPANRIQEASKANNTITRTLTVLPPAADTLAPRVDQVTIAGGQDPVASRAVTLDVTATDLPDPGGVGVADLRYVEFEYNQGSLLWIPVQDSDWISFSSSSQAYAWTLTPAGGNHYIQAWARDRVGNVSIYPNQSQINYLPPHERIGRDQARVYRQQVAAGEVLKATLTPQSGDADLYIWPPDWESGSPPWVSNLSGQAVDELRITALVSGTYQVEVYGYSVTNYDLVIDLNPAQSQRERGVSQPGGVDPGKAKLTQPMVAPDSAPPRNIPVVVVEPPVKKYVYLPAVRR